MNRRARRICKAGSVLAVALLVSAPSVAAEKDFPQQTDDGLTRVDSKRVDALYWKEGATLAPYKRVALLDCYVAFRKNWERDQNADRRELTNRVTAADMDRIRKLLADEFRKEFTSELERGGYEVVDEGGEDVLLLRPAIINLDVAAPDLNSPSMMRSYTTSAGSMTLYMELFDSATSSIIGRAIDAREGMETGGFQITNSVTNRAEADRILRSWADLLRKALDDNWSPSL